LRTNATDFFDGVVAPTVAEFFSDEGNLRRARLAAIVLYHMADYWSFETLKTEKKPKFDDALIAECYEFRLIRDVANASKHAQIHRNDPQLKTSQQVSGPSGIFFAPFGEGVFGEAAEVFLRLDDGTVRPISPLIRSVTEFWKCKVEALKKS